MLKTQLGRNLEQISLKLSIVVSFGFKLYVTTPIFSNALCTSDITK